MQTGSKTVVIRILRQPKKPNQRKYFITKYFRIGIIALIVLASVGLLFVGLNPNVFKTSISSAAPAFEDASVTPRNSIEDIVVFEGGEVLHLQPGLFIAPYPTETEFSDYILNGSV